MNLRYHKSYLKTKLCMDILYTTEVQYGLQTPNSIRWSAVQDRVAVVHLAVNQRVDESMQRVEGDRPSDGT